MSSIHSNINSPEKPISLLGLLLLNNKLNVILADDDSDDRELFEEAITELNSKIKLSLLEDGIQLMNILNKENPLPDIIFLDMNMPRKSGKKCLEEIRSNPEYNDLFIIIYSTSSNPKDVEEVYKLGANLYLRKPNSYTELIEILKTIFSLNLQKYKPKALKNDFVLNPGRYKLIIHD